MWTGYSLLYIMGNENAHGQDLGSPGSCLRRFSVMPYMACDVLDKCYYSSRNDYSYWLSTREPKPVSNHPIPANDVQKYVSRCAVCESITQVIAVHSQTKNIPECPPKWDSVWVGWSFFMNTDAGAEGSGQPLNSPGSCLQEFRANPFIECQGHGQCNYYTTAFSFWLATIDDNAYFNMPQPQILKNESLKQKISRCNVCVRRFEPMTRTYYS